MLTLLIIIRTVWEIKQKILVDMAVDRGCYIDQSQSLNIHMDKPNFGKLTSLHFYAWSKVSTFQSNIKMSKHIYLLLLNLLMGNSDQFFADHHSLFCFERV